MISQSKRWSRILGFQVGQKIRIKRIWIHGRSLEGRKGTIIKIGYDSSHSFLIYYTKVNWIKWEFQLVEGEFEAIEE